MGCATVGRIRERHDGRAAPAMTAIISNNGLEVAALGGLADRIAHRRARFIPCPAGDCEAICRAGRTTRSARRRWVRLWFMTGSRRRRPSYPAATVQIDPLPLEDFSLAVKRQEVCERRDNDPGEDQLREQPAGPDMFGRRRLRHGLRQRRQGYFGRRVTSNRNCAGTRQAARTNGIHWLLAGSITRSTRGVVEGLAKVITGGFPVGFGC